MRKRVFFVVFTTLLACAMLLPAAAGGYSGEDFAGNNETMLFAVDTPGALSSETSLGSAVADAARFASGADIAIVNGGNFCANLPGGGIHYSDCLSVFAEDRDLATVLISPSELKELLETGVSRVVITKEEYIDHENSEFEGFPQISGFTFMYDLSAPVGERIVWIKMDGKKLDLQSTAADITLCATDHMLSGGWGYPVHPAQPTGYTLSTALFEYIQESGTLKTSGTLRIQTRGSNESHLFAILEVSPWMLLLAVICFAAVGGYKLKPFYDFGR